MQFTKLGDLEVVTRITGPHHHILGIELSPYPAPSSPILERVSFDRPEAELEAFDPQSGLCREVVDGVSEANDRLGTRFEVTKIRYCSDDVPIPGIYGRLAQALVEHVVQEQEGFAAKPSRVKFQEILKQLASIEIDRLGLRLSNVDDRSFEEKANAALEKAQKEVFPKAVEELLAELGSPPTAPDGSRTDQQGRSTDRRAG
jgi:hypothetical protein